MEHLFESVLANDTDVGKQFNPENSFVCFLTHHSNLCNKLRSGARMASCTIVRSDRIPHRNNCLPITCASVAGGSERNKCTIRKANSLVRSRSCSVLPSTNQSIRREPTPVFQYWQFWQSWQLWQFSSPLVPVSLQNLVHLLRRQVFMQIVVHLHRRCPTACSDALYFFNREHAIGRGLF